MKLNLIKFLYGILITTSLLTLTQSEFAHAIMFKPKIGGDILSRLLNKEGNYPSMQIDNDGFIHVVFYEEPQQNLIYATNKTGSWISETIDNTYNTGIHNSLAIDSANNIHVIYYALVTGNLKYATNASGSWVTNNLTGTLKDKGIYTSIAIDSNDAVHIAYMELNMPLRLHYGTNASGSWKHTSLFSSSHKEDVGLSTSIAIDSNDVVHITYVNGTKNSLDYITNSSGSWVNQTIDNSATVCEFGTSIKIDSSDRLHIAYVDCSDYSIKYASNKNPFGKWITQTIESGFVFGQPNLAIDKNDDIHISYTDYDNDDLKYVSSITGNIETIDSDGEVGYLSKIDIGPSDNVVIFYYDSSNVDFVLSENSTGSWVREIVDTLSPFR